MVRMQLRDTAAICEFQIFQCTADGQSEFRIEHGKVAFHHRIVARPRVQVMAAYWPQILPFPVKSDSDVLLNH